MGLGVNGGLGLLAIQELEHRLAQESVTTQTKEALNVLVIVRSKFHARVHFNIINHLPLSLFAH